MPTALYELMRPHEDEIIEQVVQRLKNSTLPHYRDMDIQLLEDRVARLMEIFLVSIDDDPTTFVSYIRDIAEERIAEGFLLREVLCALNIFEERAWRIVTAEAPLEDQVLHLSTVSGTVGAAKDALVRVYLNHMEAANAQVRLLEKKIEEMYKGVDVNSLLDGDELGI